jgi:putative ABC transport system permease protein
MLQDLRFAVRALLKTPGYTAVALAALALGLGANTAIFSFVDGMLLRPLPYPHADRLYVPVSINTARLIERGSVGYADYEDWRRESDLFDAVAVFQRGIATLSGGGADPERVPSLSVSEDFFALVNVQPLAGRVLQPFDQAADASRVAVIGYGLWQRRFGGDPAIVGRTTVIGGVPHEIVGVLPPRATYPEDTQVFLPLVPTRYDQADRERRDNLIFEALARLRPDATPEQAEARMRAIAERVAQENPASRAGWTNGLLPLREYIVEPELKMALFVLLGAVGAVLLIACANLANLSLVRGAGRAREIGVRLAVGASRARVIRQLLAESLVLGVAGAVLGVGFAALSIDALVAIVPPGAPFVDHVALDARVLAAATAIALCTIGFVGVVPAFTASGIHVTAALREGARGAVGGLRSGRLRAAIVVGEVAAAVVLLVAAGLLVRSLDRLTRTPSGVDLDRVLSARLGVPGSRYNTAQRVDFYRNLLARLSAEPGVQAAAATSYLPAGGGGFGLGRVFLAQGQPEPPAGPDVPAMWTVATPDYFRALGIPLVSGRVFDDRDSPTGPPAIIVSRAFATNMFGDQNPIGRRVRSWRDENVYREIVGVVADVSLNSLADPARSVVYVPHAQQGWGNMTLALRAASGDPARLTNTLRRVMRELDPELALAEVGTLAVFARNSIARERVSATLMSGLALVAVALATLGIYGVMSYSVSQRRQEMGVRLALGAAPRDVYRLVFLRGIGLTAAGLVIGLGMALATVRLMTSLLYQTSAFDPVAFGGMALVLAVTATIACLVPARRAAGSDPLMALRSE